MRKIGSHLTGASLPNTSVDWRIVLSLTHHSPHRGMSPDYLDWMCTMAVHEIVLARSSLQTTYPNLLAQLQRLHRAMHCPHFHEFNANIFEF